MSELALFLAVVASGRVATPLVSFLAAVCEGRAERASGMSTREEHAEPEQPPELVRPLEPSR